MIIKLELFGASRELSDKNFIEFNFDSNKTIKDLRNNLLDLIDKNFQGNENFKKLINSSVFCSEKNEIVKDDYKILKDQKIGIIPPIGGG